MRRTRRAAALAVAALVLSPVVAHATTSSGDAPASAPSFAPWLEQHLSGLSALAPLRVAVRGTSTEAATAAAQRAGLAVQQTWPLVDTVVGIGTAAQVQALRTAPGVVHVEGDTPLAPTLQTAHVATRSDEALAAFADTAEVTGEGVTIAVIDSGIDGTHPMFDDGGTSKVVRNLKNLCGVVLIPATRDLCFQHVPTNDTDTISVGGHGTHVAGIAAGSAVTTSDGTELRGAATGAKLVGLSVGAAIGLLDAMSAQNWVLEHQQNPCRARTAQTEDEVDADCPPIRVTNHSYGPAASTGGNSFNESSAAVALQRALVDKGVVAVWAAGNDGGDGSAAFTNPDAMDPTPGILMVASYDDAQTGDRDHRLSTFSSRGRAGDQITYPDLAAPGDRITSACRLTLVICQGSPSFDNGNYQTISGTSMAAPYVAGVVAQLFSANPGLTPADVERILTATAHPFTAGAAYETGADGRRTSFDKGAGLVDVLAALEAALGAGATDPEPTPTASPEPTATATANPEPTATATADPEPTATATATATAEPSPTCTPRGNGKGNAGCKA